MKLTNDFTVPARIDEAFAVLLDVERVAPCLPGAALDGGDGRTYRGTMKLKLGPLTSRFEGTVEVVEADPSAHRAVLRAQAKDATGQGAAAATITTSMRAMPAGTRVSVETDLQVSGPVAQFGRGVMQDVSGKLMRQFADCLAEEMQADGFIPGTAPAADDVQLSAATHREPARGSAVIDYEETAVGLLPKGPAADAALAAVAGPAAPRRQRRSAEVLDLGAASRGAVLKRLLPAAAAAAAATLALVLWRRQRP